MHALAIILLASPKHGFLRWLIRLGGPGLILLGLADNSVIPLPGSMDVFTIWLAAYHRDIWFYYAIMATAGAVIGGYLTYRITYRGGKATLEKKFNPRKVEKTFVKFERWGFWAVAIPALLPPPFPIVPALLAAGALQYPRKKFLAALALGRGIRYTILAFLGMRFGTHIVRFFSRYYEPAMFILIGLAVVGGVLALVEYKRAQKHGSQESKSRKPTSPARVA
jgi:membrane protein YqaA with SNARE-associated domain